MNKLDTWNPVFYKIFLTVCALIITGLTGPASAQAQGYTVTGHVLSSVEEEALPGVNVLVRGTSIGTATNLEGEFSLTVPSGDAVLVFTYIGYETLEVELDGREQLEIRLTPQAILGEELIVVGYGAVRQEAVTGSVESMRGETLREMPSPNISRALQGRMPGIEISQTSSQPGAGMQIRIRGTRSLTASNDPLVVLNGIPFSGSINDINPNDIESLDILKDASATAIYGSRGANGVILVTTRTGQIGQPATLSYSGYHGISDIFSKYPMMDGPEFVKMRQLAGQYENGPDEFNDVNIDWQDLFYQTGMITSHDIGLAGGTSHGTYNFGLGYYGQEGVVPTQAYQRISLRAAVDQRVGEHFRFGLTSNNNYNITEGSQIDIYSNLSATPIANPYNEDGSWRRTVRMALDENWVSTRDVLNNLDGQWLNESRSFASYNALYAEVELPWVEGLTYRANLGLDYRQSNGGEFTGRGINSVNPDTESSAAVSNSHTYHWIIENLLMYDRTFSGVHNLNLTGLYSAEENKYNRSSMTARDIPAEAFQFYNLGHANGEININPDGQVYERWGLMSWMGRAMYSYDDRYMITATIRSDGSSRLAEGYKWHTYPAVSVGWNLGREDFMQDVDFLNQLKLRVGYGQTSNQAITPYATLGRLNTRPYNFGDSHYATGFYVSQLPNQSLGWEYSETWNFAADFGLFNGRLSGTVEYYTTHTKDILLNVSLPSTAGVSSYTANIGETENKGIELSLHGILLENPDGWGLEAGVNIYGNRNKLVALASEQERDESNWWFVGHPIDVIYDHEYIGIWQEDDPYLDILEPGGNPGMIKVKYDGEFNPDGTPVRAIGPADRQIISLEPTFQGGFNTRLSYKQLTFDMIGSFKQGGKLISTLHSGTGYLNMLSGRRNNVDVDYWTPDNPDGKYPLPGGITSGDNPKYANTLGYFDASYLKIRTMTLGYNFSASSWLENAGIRELRVYASVQNPFVLFSPFNNETGLDPEPNSYGDENAAVTSYHRRLLTLGTNAPATRNYMLGINFTF